MTLKFFIHNISVCHTNLYNSQTTTYRLRISARSNKNKIIELHFGNRFDLIKTNYKNCSSAIGSIRIEIFAGIQSYFSFLLRRGFYNKPLREAKLTLWGNNN